MRATLIAVGDREHELAQTRLAPGCVDEVSEQGCADPAAGVLGSDVHAEDDRLVMVLRARLARAPDDAHQRTVDECAVDDVAAVRSEAAHAVGKRLLRFFIVARGERVGVQREPAQPQRAIGGGVGGQEPANPKFR